MITDILSMVWKEKLEDKGQQRSWRDRIVGSIFPVLSLSVMAVVPPLSMGPDWVSSPFPFMTSIFVPFMVLAMSIPLSITREREQKTLETLLASRLPDQAILLGKILPPISKAFEATLSIHLVSLVALNFAFWDGSVIVFSPSFTLAHLAAITLVAVFAASLGVLVSLRATTVKQALQNLLAILMSPFMLVMVTVILIGKVFPAAWRLRFEAWFERVVMTADLSYVLIDALVVLAVIDLVLFVAALARFKRGIFDLD